MKSSFDIKQCNSYKYETTIQMLMASEVDTDGTKKEGKNKKGLCRRNGLMEGVNSSR